MTTATARTAPSRRIRTSRPTAPTRRTRPNRSTGSSPPTRSTRWIRSSRWTGSTRWSRCVRIDPGSRDPVKPSCSAWSHCRSGPATETRRTRDTCPHGARAAPGVRAAGRRDHGRDPPGRPGRLRRGQGHARGDVPGQQLPAVLQHQPAHGRDRGPADLPEPRPGQRGAAGRRERRGGRRGQLRAAQGRPGHGRGRVRGGRPHAPQGHRHPAARAPGLAGPEPPDHHVHGRDADREQGHAGRLRRRRPAGAPPLRRWRHRADLPAARPGRRGPRLPI